MLCSATLNTVVSRKVVLFSDNVINVAFPFPWLGIALLDYFCFNFHHENIGKRYNRHFSSHSNSTLLEKVLPIELNSLRDSASRA